MYHPLIGIVRLCKHICWLLLISGFSLHTSPLYGSEKQRLMVLDDRLVVIREALLTNDQKLRSLHKSYPEVAALTVQFKLMSLNAVNRFSSKWHKVLSLPVEAHDLGPTIYAKSPEWRTMTELTEMRYALSGVWIAAPKISIAKEETDTSKLHIFLKSAPYRVIPTLNDTPDLSVLMDYDRYQSPDIELAFDLPMTHGELPKDDRGSGVDFWQKFRCNFLRIERSC